VVIRPYLDLVRAPLTPSAIADSFARFSLAFALRRSAAPSWEVLAVAAASVLVYWMGMATNDLFDVEKDRARGVPRPIARGAIRPVAAALIAAALGACGLACGLAASVHAGMAVLTLILLALLYNAGGKELPILGNLLMGACRSVNFLIGALAVIPLCDLPGTPDVPEGAALLGLYIAGVTAVSVLEDRPPHPGSFLFTTAPLLVVPVILGRFFGDPPWALVNACILAIFLVSAMADGTLKARRTNRIASMPAGEPVPRGAGSPGSPPDRLPPGGDPPPPSVVPFPESSSAACGVTGTSLSPEKSGDVPPAPGAGRPGRHPAEEFVRSGLMGIFLIDAGFLLRGSTFRQAAAEYGLLILAWLCRRGWLQSTA
jgi:hypothetical protein